jgi:plastocyanin
MRKEREMRLVGALLVASVALWGAACGTDSQQPTADGAASVGASPAAAAVEVAPTGKVIEVKMVTDDRGNYFEPAEFEASPGDVVRFVLVSGVHNISFPAGDNPGAQGLPEASPYLQIPGQTHDLVVALPAGEYRFQCDPHAALGMVGVMTVRE